MRIYYVSGTAGWYLVRAKNKRDVIEDYKEENNHCDCSCDCSCDCCYDTPSEIRYATKGEKKSFTSLKGADSIETVSL